ncbi:phospholipase/carboxylesterase [Pseudonocardia thermophila]|uniref:Phospholipase/carboxylesterase n=1 Tax=Pseudonocardia thermophila TaxID=1848 RepID=A0A1M6PH67_PSETH|nr:luciferase family protein [Pseudonocardia thermophila]SHK07296.1 phospholipase/carboxylesterase [Pseudonocardia thermophila]
MVAQRSTGPGDVPMVARWGTDHPSAPLVVVLHGNGTSEHSVIEMAPWLPHGPVAYVAVRAPLPHERGFTWFGTSEGRPDPAGLAATCRWLLRFLDGEGDPERPVLLIGFREGATVAGALALAAPERFGGLALLYGALPIDTGGDRGRLRGVPVYLAVATDDTRTPAALLARTWAWLAQESGAPVLAERVPGGDQLAGTVVDRLGTWLGDRLDHIHAHGESPLPDADEPPWPTVRGGRLRPRAGPPPELSAGVPQFQVTQTAPDRVREQLWALLAALPGVTTGPATVGVPGTRSVRVPQDAAPESAFVLAAEGELAHLHPDGSVHTTLPEELAYDALTKGWAFAHPLAGVRVARGLVLVPGPRDEVEVATVLGIVGAAHRAVMG